MGFLIDRFLPENAAPTLAFGDLLVGREDHNSGAFLHYPVVGDGVAYFPSLVSRAYNQSGLIATVTFQPGTTGNARWAIAFERHQVGATNLSLLTNFAAEVGFTGPALGVNVPAIATVTLSHAQVGQILNGETYRVRLYRRRSDAADTIAAGVLFMALELQNATV